MQHTLRHWAARCALALAAALPLVCAAQGNSKGTITVAQAGPVGGPIGFYTQSIQQGMAACFGWINSQGGVRGQRLELLLADTPLDAFTSSFYRYLLSRLDALPARLQAIAPRIAAHDWLGSYRERASVDLAVTRIATRLSRNGERLVECLDDLRRHEARIGAGFDAFFPQLVAHVQALRREPRFAAA